jgi:hypothetical protein
MRLLDHCPRGKGELFQPRTRDQGLELVRLVVDLKSNGRSGGHAGFSVTGIRSYFLFRSKAYVFESAFFGGTVADLFADDLRGRGLLNA